MKREKSRDESRESREEANWQKARQQAAQRGIVLTRRKAGDGRYFCYLGKGTKNSLLFGI
jgi:hypothetical protein